jgi:hypothetical protein
MMLLKILLVGTLIVGCMAAVKDGRVLRHVGLLSSCTPVAGSGSDQTLQRCRKGRLDGYPDLSNKSCEAIYIIGGDEYWRCLAPVVASQSPRG